MATVLHAVGTAVPAHRYEQSYVREVMGRWLSGDRRTTKLLDRVYGASAIDARHSVLDDFLPVREPASSGSPRPRPPLFLDETTGGFRSASTGARNARYALEAGPLAVRAAQDAFRRVGSLRPADVTHLVTVSCTGFATPGTDLELVRALGLPADVERYHLGFMGCFAAFPALRLARAFCAQDPDALVLVVCVELCTLHLQDSADVDAILSGSVFADGAAAALLSGRAAGGEVRTLRLDATSTAVTRTGADEMAWTIGDHGFDMTLTAYVPRVLEAEAAEALAPLLTRAGVAVDDVPWWAVHPGGRAIVDKIVGALALPETAVAASREVLRLAGNMSSATVLFVLERLMDPAQPGPAPGEAVAALAFGPGLTVDGALFRALPVD
jgi:predicted naringenin-chalcone synthase